MNVLNTTKTFLMLKTDGGLRHVDTHVVISWDYETDAPDFEYGNDIDNARESQRFKSGELLNVFLVVKASALGETGTDSLGQVFVRASHFEADLIQTAIEHDMKNNACFNLRENLISQYNALKNVFEGKTA